MRIPFAFQAAMLALPVLVLAGMAGAGIRAQRNAVRDDAAAAARAVLSDARRRLTRDLESALRTAPPVRPRPAVPVSGAPSDAAREFDTARSLPAAEVVPALRALLANPRPAGESLTSSGVPVAALAAFELLRLDPVAATLETFTETAVTRSPSFLTPELLRRAAGFFPDETSPERAVLKRAELQWARDETMRALLPPDAPDAPLTLTSSGLVAGPSRDSNEPGAWRALSPEETNNILASNLAAAGSLSPFSEWGGLFLMIDGAPYLPDQRFSTDALVLAAEPFPPLRLEACLLKPDSLYARELQLAWWAGGLVAVSVLTAVIGLLLLRRTLLRERRLNALKSDFVSSVSHELRAPVGSIRLMADALAAGALRNEGQAREFHRLIARESARLSSLIENVLDFARMEDGRREWRFAETDLASLTVETARVMEPAAQARGVRVKCDTRPLREVPHTDAAAVQQALVNLLDNALKFSPSGGTVGVLLEGDAKGWSLSVTDEGPGVPEAERERIFERFYRPGGELRRETQGAGIGLSLVKQIAEAHGGTIRADTAPGGSGARFTFSAPWTPPTASR